MYWLITQEAVAPSRHDWKIVDWDIKPQHKPKPNLTEVSEQPRGGTPAFNVKAICDQRHTNISKQRTLLVDVDVALPHRVA